MASFQADLSGLAGGAAVVFASGFLTPDDNKGGPAFGLFAALPNGQVVALPQGKGRWAVSAAMEADGDVPNSFELAQNYPNPFNPSTTITFALPTASNVNLRVYNLLGQEVITLLDGAKEAGFHSIDFDASELASGVYFYRIETDNNVETKKMMLVK